MRCIISSLNFVKENKLGDIKTPKGSLNFGKKTGPSVVRRYGLLRCYSKIERGKYRRKRHIDGDIIEAGFFSQPAPGQITEQACLWKEKVSGVVTSGATA